MTLKSLPAGNLIDYVQSETDYKGQDRSFDPRWVGPGPKLSEDFLDRLSPPHVRHDHKRRLVGHCRQHLTHLIIGFSESFEAVEKYRPIVIRSMECLLAAGMPLDSVQAVWCEHPLLEGSHLHGCLVRSLLPGGGAYGPDLSGALAVDCGWLVSRRLGYSLPSGKARLIHAGEFSYRREHRQRINEICKVTHDEFNRKQLNSREQFLELLRDGLKRSFQEN